MAYDPQGGLGSPAWAEAAQAVTVGAAVGDETVWTGRGVLYGWSLTNASTTAATVTIFDGSTSGGQLLATIPVPASSTVNSGPNAPGLRVKVGLDTHQAGASVTGVVYVADASEIGPGRAPHRAGHGGPA